MTTTTITITDNPDGGVSLEMHSDHKQGEKFTTGLKLASRMLKAGEALMSEHQFTTVDQPAPEAA